MPAPKGSGDSTIENSCSRFTSGMVGVDWLWAPTEEVSIWKVFCHHFKRRNFKVRLGERFTYLPESCITRSSLAAPGPTTLKKRVWGNSIQKKAQTGMQSVTYSFLNITALSIIDIINQLLRATESGRVA